MGSAKTTWPSTSSMEEPKEEKSAEHINLKVKGQDGTSVFFKIKGSTPLKKLMDAYCTRQAVAPDSIAFLFDGKRIQPTQTPNELEMEDEDEIDAMLHQVGGC